jgi:hypothetical protein
MLVTAAKSRRTEEACSGQTLISVLNEADWLGVARPLPRIEQLLDVTGLTELANFRVFST